MERHTIASGPMFDTAQMLANNVLIDRERVHKMQQKVTNRMMVLYHVTNRANWYSIAMQGLQVAFSNSAHESIFLCSRDNLKYTLQHCSRLYGTPVNEFIVVEVAVRRSKLSRVTWRGVRRGLWRHNASISPSKIMTIYTVDTKNDKITIRSAE